MTPRRGLMVGALGALGAVACRGQEREAPGAGLGAAVAGAVRQGLAEATAVVSPWPCAELEQEVTAAAPPGWELRDGALRPSHRSSKRTVAFVGDAGGAAESTLARLRLAARAFAEREVSAVFSLGGLGEDAAAIEATLRALTSGPAYVVVALPGDLEPLPAHRQAIAALARDGLPVLDGSAVRWIELEGATIGTLPGVPSRDRLPAADEGCAFDAAALAATAAELGRRPGVKILATWTAPRVGSAVTPAGDRELAQALADNHIDVAVFGERTETSTPAGEASRGARALSAGLLDGEPRAPSAGTPPRPSARLLELSGATPTWRALELSMQPSR
ncbi:MAG: hypothetical protein R3B48_17570 [Kofleriaceae bacterium]